MRIGPHQLSGRVLLAPMVGVTDRPFRMLCRAHGAALATSEMINSKTDYRYDRRTLRRLDHTGEPAPRSVQILGNDPQVMAECAQFSVDQGADIIDINMGCPAKKVCRRAAGSALMGDLDLARQIFEAMVKAVSVPVTLKMRLGLTLEAVNALEMAHVAEQSGIQALAIHGRSRACFYQGEARYEVIAQVKQSVGIPVVANGDIDTLEKARFVLDYTQADGVMIGRAAQRAPWLFAQMQHYLDTGERSAPPSVAVRKALLVNHLKALYAFYDAPMGVRIARKHVRWQCEMQDPADHAFWIAFHKLDTPEAQLAYLQTHFKTGVLDAVS